MSKKHFHPIGYFKAQLEAINRQKLPLKAPSMASAIQHLKALYAAGQATFVSNAGRESIYLADVVDLQSSHIAAFLVNRSDANKLDHVLSAPAHNVRRVINKNKAINEGEENSCHVIISCQPDSSGMYDVFIELVEGISYRKVTTLINFMLKEAAKLDPDAFQANHPAGHLDASGKPLAVKFRPRLQIDGVPSDQFKQDITSGFVSNLELLDVSNQDGMWDSQGRLVESYRSVVLKATSQKGKSGLWAAIVNLASKQKNTHKLLKIKFKTAQGVDRSVKLLTDTLHLADTAQYLKTTFLPRDTSANTTSLTTVQSDLLIEISKIAKSPITKNDITKGRLKKPVLDQKSA